MRDSVIPAPIFSGALFSFSRLLLPPGPVMGARAGRLPSTRGKVGSEEREGGESRVVTLRQCWCARVT